MPRLALLPVFLLLTACVSTTYVSGPPQKGGAMAPVYVELDRHGPPSALGRTYPSSQKLATHLRAAKASAKGGRPVVIRCKNPDAMDQAERLRRDLVREGVPNVTIQGPRKASSSLGPDNGRW